MAGAAADAGGDGPAAGVCERTFRRRVDRHEDEELDGLIDERLGQAAARRAPVDSAPRRRRIAGAQAGLMPRKRSLRRRSNSTTTSRQTDSRISSVATARIVGLICSRMPENIAHGIVRCS